MTMPLSDARIARETDRIMALLPAHVRLADAQGSRALEALIGVLAQGLSEVDREIDHGYDALFAETAPEAALDDIAALIGAIALRPLPADAGFSTRGYIANTLRYRRGKGTARVIEALAADVGGFGAVAVEYFMRLARTAHLADVRPERPGTALLVPGETAARTAGAFDMSPRLADLRSIARAGGRHHVPLVGVHIVRPLAPAYTAPAASSAVSAADMAGVPIAAPWSPGGTARAGYFQLAAVPDAPLRLFNPDRRAADTADRVTRQDLADRLARLPLHNELEERRHAALEGRDTKLDHMPWFSDAGLPFAVFLGRRQAGTLLYDRVPPERLCIANLEAAPSPAGARPAPQRPHHWFTGAPGGAVAQSDASPIVCAIDPVTGRLILADPLPGLAVGTVRVAYAFGSGRAIGAGPYDRNDPTVPFELHATGGTTKIWLVGPRDTPPPPGTQPAVSIAAAVDDWNQNAAADMRGFIVLTSCDRSGGAAPIEVKLPGGAELHIVSARFEDPQVRPDIDPATSPIGYIVRKERSFVIDVPLVVKAQAGVLGGKLVLDGVSLTAGIDLRASALSDLLLRYCTVRAPGQAAVSTTAELRGTAVRIERSITGPIRLERASGTATGSLAVADTIVAADGAGGLALDALRLETHLHNVTVIGAGRVKQLEATNVLFTESVTVTRTQAGCVRYSWIPDGSVVPRTFRCQPNMVLAAAAAIKDAALTPTERAAITLANTPQLLDTALDEPTVAMLAAHVPDTIRMGGEGEAEIGAFAAAALGLRQANMRTLFEDFMPFGTEAGLIDDTRSSAIAMRRNRP